MLSRQKLAAAFLIFALTLAPAWAASQLLAHHHDGAEAEGATHGPRTHTELAEALIHGHPHPASVPDHEHHFLPSSPVGPQPLRTFGAPASALPQAPALEPMLLAPTSALARAQRLAGPSPPLLLLLCTLLI